MACVWFQCNPGFCIPDTGPNPWPEEICTHDYPIHSRCMPEGCSMGCADCDPYTCEQSGGQWMPTSCEHYKNQSNEGGHFCGPADGVDCFSSPAHTAGVCCKGPGDFADPGDLTEDGMWDQPCGCADIECDFATPYSNPGPIYDILPAWCESACWPSGTWLSWDAYEAINKGLQGTCDDVCKLFLEISDKDCGMPETYCDWDIGEFGDSQDCIDAGCENYPGRKCCCTLDEDDVPYCAACYTVEKSLAPPRPTISNTPIKEAKSLSDLIPRKKSNIKTNRDARRNLTNPTNQVVINYSEGACVRTGGGQPPCIDAVPCHECIREQYNMCHPNKTCEEVMSQIGACAMWDDYLGHCECGLSTKAECEDHGRNRHRNTIWYANNDCDNLPFAKCPEPDKEPCGTDIIPFACYNTCISNFGAILAGLRESCYETHQEDTFEMCECEYNVEVTRCTYSLACRKAFDNRWGTKTAEGWMDFCLSQLDPCDPNFPWNDPI